MTTQDTTPAGTADAGDAPESSQGPREHHPPRWLAFVRRRRAALLGHGVRRRLRDRRRARPPARCGPTSRRARDLYDEVAYGLPALQDGRWWTFFTGMFFAPQLALYVPILLLLVVVASIYERRVGHVRTIVVAHRRAVPRRPADARCSSGCSTTAAGRGPAQLGTQLDLGISAGGFALRRRADRRDAAGLAHPHPGRRSAPTSSRMLLNSGLLWDVEHFIAFALGVVAGPFLAGRRARARRRSASPAARSGRSSP